MADPKVKACLTFAGANNATSFSDTLGNAWTSGGGAKLSTTSPLFAPASGLCAAAGDYFTSDAGAAHKLGAGDFAVEVWFETSADDVALLDASDGDSVGGYRLAMAAGGSNPSLFIYSNGGLFLETFLSPLGLNFKNAGLCYVCFQRIGTRVGVFFGSNGGAVKYLTYGDVADSTNLHLTAGAVLLGRQGFDPANRRFVGKFGGVRVTSGGSRWAWADIATMPSPYDVLGGGSTIVEASATVTADASASAGSAQIVAGLGAATADGQAAAGSQLLLGAVATIADQNLPYVPAYGDPAAYFPPGAYRLTVANRAQMQTALDTYGVVRLDAGDYYTGGPANVVIKPGQKLIGIPGVSIVPKITIQAGCSAATVMGVTSGDSFNFPTSSTPTVKNAFGMIRGDMIATGATLEQNLIASSNGVVRIDNSGGGYARNNRWVRTHTHGLGGDGLACFLLKGGAGRTSFNNTIVGFNTLGAVNAGLEVSGQDTFSVVGFDEESYAPHADGKASLVARDVGTLNVMGVGGVVYGNDGVDSGADKTNIIYHQQTATSGGKRIRLQAEAASAAWWRTNNSAPADAAVGALRVTETANFTLQANGITPASLTSAAALAHFVPPLPPTSVAWGGPQRRPVPDPAGPNWNVGLAGKADDVPALQALCNAGLVVELEPRIYYFGSTLKVRPNQVFNGVAGQTAFVAKDSSLQMIETNWGNGSALASPYTAALTMIDLVMQGGKNGLHQSEGNTQLNEFWFVNVTFRDMVEAGTFLDNAYAWDNGWFQHCNFHNCGAGVKQRQTIGDGTGPTIAYIDKTNFFRCQWTSCGLPLDMECGRADNLNTWTECYFEDNTGSAVMLVGGHNYPTFTNCAFINNGGTVAVDAKLNQVMLVGCQIVGSAANTALVSPSAILEGCTLSRGAGNAVLFDLANVPFSNAYYIGGAVFNCTSIDVPFGNLLVYPTRLSMLAVNSSFPEAEANWQKPISAMRYDSKGTYDLGDDVRTTQFAWLDGGVIPGTRFLRDIGGGGGPNNVAFTATSIAGAVGALTGDAPGAGAGGAIASALWEASADAAGAFNSNAIVGTEGEFDMRASADVAFIATGIAGGSGVLDAIGGLVAEGGAINAGTASLDAQADADFRLSVIRSAVAEAVLELVFNANGGTPPGAGGTFLAAPALRTMYRPQKPRLMTRPEQQRVMVKT